MVDVSRAFSGSSNVFLRLRVNQTSATATTVTLRYRLNVESDGDLFFANAGSGNSWSIITGTPTNGEGSDFTYNFRSPTGPTTFLIADISRTINVSGVETRTVRASASQPDAGGIGSASIPNQTMTLTPTAPPAPTNYTLSYNSNGGSPTPGSITRTAGQSFTVASAPTRTGFTFDFWSGSNGTDYSPGTTGTMPASNLTLTASWTQVQLPDAPGAPSNFRSTSISATTIETAWNAVSGASGYYLYIKPTSAAGPPTEVSKQTGTTYTFTELQPKTSYDLEVQSYAENSAGETEGSSALITRTTLAVVFAVPNVVGQLRDSAIATLTSPGRFSPPVTVTQTSSGATSVNNRRVISQTPASGGLPAEEGSSASINVYNFLLSVPSVLGLTQSAASSLLTNAGFTLNSGNLTTFGATVQNNLTVGAQNPTGGSLANPADNVAFTVFNFLTQVPNVVGQTLENAITLLSNVGFVNVTTTVTEEGANAENNNTVKSQTPINSSTTVNPKNQAVSIVVFSLGITGRRFTGSTAIALTNAKRFTGTEWLPLTVQKRFTGTSWIDIAN